MDLKKILAGAALAVLAGVGRQKLTDVALELFDRYVEPINLPGPDAVIDPILRQAVGMAASRAYDAAVAALETMANAA
jgi:hypothetical protein